MGPYKTIAQTMWDDDGFLDLSYDTRFLWVYLLTGPHVLPIPGLAVAGIGSIADGWRNSFETVSKGFAELSEKGMMDFDERHRVIRLPRAPAFNPPANPNVLKGWWRLWQRIPESPLKFAHVASLRESIRGDAKLLSAWRETFGTVSEPSQNRLETVAQTVSNTSCHPVILSSCSTSPTPPPAAADADTTPDRELFATPELPPAPLVGKKPARRARASTESDAVAKAEREAERADGEAWRAAYCRATGTPAEGPKDTPPGPADGFVWGTAWHAFRRQRRARGIDALVRSVDGLEGDRWYATKGASKWLSDDAIAEGLRRACNGSDVSQYAADHAAAAAACDWDALDAALEDR